MKKSEIKVLDNKTQAERWMKEALSEAQKAYDAGEVPVGAVIVRDDKIIGRGYNQVEFSKDPTAHAEVLAIREAASTLGGWRLLDSTLYVTTEPCSMCAGAIVLSRIGKVVIGTLDPKAGACGSLMNIPQDARLNHFVEIECGVLATECSDMMKSFFQTLRRKNRNGGFK